MEKNEREVRFDLYCVKCESSDIDGDQEPCNSCLEVFWRDGSEIPENFVAKNTGAVMNSK